MVRCTILMKCSDALPAMKKFCFWKKFKMEFCNFFALWNCCFLLLVCVQMLSKVLHKMMIGLQIFAAVIFTSLNLIPAKNAVYHTNIKKKCWNFQRFYYIHAIAFLLQNTKNRYTSNVQTIDPMKYKVFHSISIKS